MTAVRLLRSFVFHIGCILFTLVERVGNSSYFRPMKFAGLQEEVALTLIGQEKYVISTNDQVIGRRLYLSGEFDFNKFIEAWKLAGLDGLQGELLLIDIGANVGSIGIPAVNRGYASHCIAFEPDPLNSKLLKTNVMLNDLGDKVDVFQIALGNSKSEIQFELSNTNYGDHRIRLKELSNDEDLYDEKNRSTISVMMNTLDEYTDAFKDGPCFLWMDTQGFEGYVLQGASSILQKKIPLVMEFWPYGLRRSGSYDALLDSLEESKYEHFIILDSEEKKLIPMNREALIKLYDEMAVDDNFTDILLL